MKKPTVLRIVLDEHDDETVRALLRTIQTRIEAERVRLSLQWTGPRLAPLDAGTKSLLAQERKLRRFCEQRDFARF